MIQLMSYILTRWANEEDFIALTQGEPAREKQGGRWSCHAQHVAGNGLENYHRLDFTVSRCS